MEVVHLNGGGRYMGWSAIESVPTIWGVHNYDVAAICGGRYMGLSLYGVVAILSVR